MNYKLDIDLDASEFVRSLKRKDASQVVGFMERLRESPFLAGEFTVPDEIGREIQVSRAGKLLIFYWADHLIKTIHVTAIEAFDR